MSTEQTCNTCRHQGLRGTPLSPDGTQEIVVQLCTAYKSGDAIPAGCYGLTVRQKDASSMVRYPDSRPEGLGVPLHLLGETKCPNWKSISLNPPSPPDPIQDGPVERDPHSREGRLATLLREIVYNPEIGIYQDRIEGHRLVGAFDFERWSDRVVTALADQEDDPDPDSDLRKVARELIEREDVAFYPSAIETVGNFFDLERWRDRLKKALGVEVGG